MIKLMQHVAGNQAIDKHNEKMDGMHQSIRNGKSQKLFGIERDRIRKKKKEQKRAWYQEEHTRTGAGQHPVAWNGEPRQAAAARVDDQRDEGCLVIKPGHRT